MSSWRIFHSHRHFRSIIVLAIAGSVGITVLTTGCRARAAVPSTGKAASFDGLKGNVSIPLVTQATANVSLEAWVKVPSDAKGCFIKIGDAPDGYGLGVGAAGRTFADATPGNSLIGLYEGAAWLYPTDSPTLSADAWHHVAFVIGAAGSAPTFYVDGKPYIATAAGTPHAPSNVATIGGNGIGGPRFSNATIARVAVYDSALSAERIALHASAKTDADYDALVRADSPVAFYELDESIGPSANDNSGNSNTGTYNDGVTLSNPGPFASPQPPVEQKQQ